MKRLYTQLDELEELVREISSCESPQQTMTVAYLRDISSLLALVSAVREGNFERHLEAEREMLKQVFAFDHQNYSRYLTFQHVLLTDLKSSNNPAYQELLERGFGANYSGEKFATVHGDLVTEYFNRETKGTAGPFRSGFSTNIETTNNWVKTIHITQRFALQCVINLTSKPRRLTKSLRIAVKQNTIAMSLL